MNSLVARIVGGGSTSLNHARFSTTLLGGMAVLTAMIMQNGLVAQRGMPSRKIGPLKLCQIVFVLGWVLVALSMSSGVVPRTQREMVAAAGAAAVVFGAFTVMKARDASKKPATWVGLLFVAGWLAVALAASTTGTSLKFKERGGHGRHLVALAVVGLVLGSTMYVLPWQRKNPPMVDGPGMPMLALAWVLLAALNASS